MSPEPLPPRALRAAGLLAASLPVAYAVLRLLLGGYLLAAALLGGLGVLVMMPAIAAMCLGRHLLRTGEAVRRGRAHPPR